jgi:hypothetical protein
MSRFFTSFGSLVELLNDTPWDRIGSDITTAVTSYYEESTRQREQQAEERLKQRIEAIKNKKDQSKL